MNQEFMRKRMLKTNKNASFGDNGQYQLMDQTTTVRNTPQLIHYNVGGRTYIFSESPSMMFNMILNGIMSSKCLQKYHRYKLP